MQREAKLGNSKKKEENSQHPPAAKDVDLQPSESPPPSSDTQAPPNGTGWAWIKDPYTLQAIFTGVIALAAVLQFVVILFQVSVMKGQLSQMQTDSALTRAGVDAATRQANLMETGVGLSKSAMEASAAQSKAALDASIQIARNDQRAWVGFVTVLPRNFTVDSKKVYLIAGHPEATFGVTITNSGKSPALELKTLLNCKFMPATEEFLPTYELDTAEARSASLSVLQPGMRMELITNLKRGLTIDEIEHLQSGRAILYVFGHIEYRDIFHRPHFTNFCARLKQDLARMETHGTYNKAN